MAFSYMLAAPRNAETSVERNNIIFEVIIKTVLVVMVVLVVLYISMP
jgi:hypothetical protein